MTDIEVQKAAFRLFGEVCALDAAERDRRLAAEAPSVAERVRKMLDADARSSDGHSTREADPASDFLRRQIERMDSATLPMDAGSASDLPATPGENQYRLLRLIGEGGMGAVYEAEQVKPRRRVAVKVIRPGRLTPQMRKRFEYEAEVLAKLQHPGIARLYEADTQAIEGKLQGYLAMELVDGLPVDQYADARHLDIPGRLRLFLKVCEPVAYAHRVGVIHRDLKPGNILIDTEGHPKVLDFGVARSVGDNAASIGDPSMTQTGQIVGTLAYMAPEQAQGSSQLDVRVDVYALGVLLHKLLTGKLPIDVGADSVITAVKRIVEEKPQPVTRWNPRLPKDIEVIVAKCLEKDVDRRYQSVAVVIAEITRHLEGKPIEARGDSAFYIMRTAAWRYRHVLAAACAIFAVLATFAVYATLSAASERRLAEDARAARDEALAAKDRAQSEQQRARAALYFSQIGYAQAALERNDIVRVNQLLDACPPELRNWEWHHLRLTADQSRRTAYVPAIWSRMVDFDSAGRRVIASSPECVAAVADALTGTKIVQWKFETQPAVAISGDGLRVLVATTLPEAFIADATTGDVVLRFRDHFAQYTVLPEPVRGAAATQPADPAAATRPGVSRLPAIPDPVAPRPPINSPPADASTFIRAAAFSRDGSLIAMSGNDARVRIFDARTGRQGLVFFLEPRTERTALCLQFSADNRYLFAGTFDGKVLRIDLKNKVLDAAYRGMTLPIICLAVSADGSRVAAGVTASRTAVWEGTAPDPIIAFDGPWRDSVRLDITPDGSHLFVGSADSAHYVWDINASLADATNPSSAAKPRPRVRMFRGHTNTLFGIRYDPDSKSLTTMAYNGVIKTWDPFGPEDVPAVPTSQGAPIEVRFADNNTIFVSGSDGTVKQIAIDRTALTPFFLRAQTRRIVTLRVFDNARRLLTAGDDGGVQVWDAATAMPIMRLRTGGPPVFEVVIWPDLSKCFIADAKSGSVVDLRSGKILATYVSPGVVVCGASLSPDTKTLAIGTGNGHVILLDALSLKPLASVRLDTSGAVFRAAFSPDGKHVAACTETTGVWLLDPRSLATQAQLVGHQNGVFGLAFSPDGTRLASAGIDRTVRLWDVPSGTEVITLRGHTQLAGRVDFSPDGRLLASTSSDGTVRIWPANTRKIDHSPVAPARP